MLHRWTRDLPIRRKFRVVGWGAAVPFGALLVLAVVTYASVSSEVAQTVALGRRGDEALVAGSKIDHLLLVQNSLLRLSNQAASPPGGVADPTVFARARETFESVEPDLGRLEAAAQASVLGPWSDFQRAFLDELPGLLDDRMKTRQKFDDAFQRLEELTAYYQERLTNVADSGVLLAQTRAIFAVLTLLRGREGPYLDDRELSIWAMKRREWLEAIPNRGVYSLLAREYLTTVDATLVPTLEAWMGERARVDLGLLRYEHDQGTRNQVIVEGLMAEKSRYLGLIQSGLADRAASQTSLQNQSLTFLIALVVLGLAGIAVLLWILRLFESGLVSPLAAATRWASRIREGDYSARLALSRGDELGTLAGALDHLADVLNQKTSEAAELNRTLEVTVDQRTQHLARALKDLEDAQSRLVNSEKLAVLGTLAAGMAHELNTPLAAILSSSRSIHQFVEHRFSKVRAVYDALDDKAPLERVVGAALNTREAPGRRVRLGALARDLATLGATNPELQAEHWVELGLAADRDLQTRVVAHERVNDILALALEVTNLVRMVWIIETAGTQATRVVDSLRQYIVQGGPEDEGDIRLRESLETVLSLVGSHRLRNVRVVWKFDADLVLHGPPSVLTQVWINLVTNAVQAMAYRGTLTFEAEVAPRQWQVRIRDSGPGIPPEVGNRVFEPFFTLKKAQGGMGLGLDICRRLLEDRGGSIAFTSVPGDTVFEVTFPVPNVDASSGPAGTGPEPAADRPGPNAGESTDRAAEDAPRG